ncbi:N-6 DNA methylase [Chondrocystis sp. NIES-4102]|nr:N-6 DNA methylase [Chondrocystis sp. NIES-4102]
MPANTTDLERRLWDAADELRANSKLKSSEYSVPVLGLIFLRYADYRFTKAELEINGRNVSLEGFRRRGVSKADYQARGVMYLPAVARFSYLVNLPESEDTGKAINEAMKAIEAENEELSNILPQTYNRFENRLLVELLKNFNQIDIDTDLEGDAFGKIYEYFLGKFAMSEGQKGGEFFTPTSIVKLIVEILEPYHGRIYDPACGSGGMFVQSASFIARHQKNPNAEISIYGQERVTETVRLCKMNLAVHGLSGDIKEANTYYEDIHKGINKFDFVMANPPFNVDKVDKERIKGDIRVEQFGMPRADNANYLWIHFFYSALNDQGRAGFVMANSASDARSSELEIRQKLIEAGIVDVMIAVGSNFFYTVTLPCTLWFLDKGKTNTTRKDKVLFIDARHIYQQIDRAHREFTPEHIQFISNIVRLYREEDIETVYDCALLQETFPQGQYIDVAGLCNVATIEQIKEQGWSLNPGRYVGVAEKEEEDFNFTERLEELNEELEMLNSEARELEERIAENVVKLLEARD